MLVFAFKNLIVVFSLVLTSQTYAQTLPDISADLPAGVQKVSIGSFKSRAYWIPSSKPAQPVIVMIPGSGPNGPEEVAPGNLTADGQYHSLFGPYAKAFVNADYNVLMLGKPGVEYFTDGDPKNWLYDVLLYRKLSWSDLLNNLKNGVDFVLAQKDVDTSKVFLLGHSEGTQVVVDYTAANPTQIKGLFLLGYMGIDMASMVDWQLYRRDIDMWLSPDVDLDHDGNITEAEMVPWPEVAGFQPFSLVEYEESLRAEPQYQQTAESYKNAPLYAGVYDRGPIYDLTAQLPQSVYVLNGELDVATYDAQVEPLRLACTTAGKTNYSIEYIKGLGHGFSEPRGPRKQALLDNTMGPVDPGFVLHLESVARSAR